MITLSEAQRMRVLVEEKEKSIEMTITESDTNKSKYEEYNSIILGQRDLVAQINQDIKLKEEKILAVPGRGFGLPGHFRLAFCVDERVIRASAQAFKNAVTAARK